MKWANVLIDALELSQTVWETQRLSPLPSYPVLPVLQVAESHISTISTLASKEGIEITFLYISLNDPLTLKPCQGEVRGGAVLSGAVMLGRTRLIDNLVFGFQLN